MQAGEWQAVCAGRQDESAPQRSSGGVLRTNQGSTHTGRRCTAAGGSANRSRRRLGRRVHDQIHVVMYSTRGHRVMYSGRQAGHLEGHIPGGQPVRNAQRRLPACARCHAAASVVTARRSARRWRDSSSRRAASRRSMHSSRPPASPCSSAPSASPPRIELPEVPRGKLPEVPGAAAAAVAAAGTGRQCPPALGCGQGVAGRSTDRFGRLLLRGSGPAELLLAGLSGCPGSWLPVQPAGRKGERSSTVRSRAGEWAPALRFMPAWRSAGSGEGARGVRAVRSMCRIAAGMASAREGNTEARWRPVASKARTEHEPQRLSLSCMRGCACRERPCRLRKQGKPRQFHPQPPAGVDEGECANGAGCGANSRSAAGRTSASRRVGCRQQGLPFVKAWAVAWCVGKWHQRGIHCSGVSAAGKEEGPRGPAT